MAEEQMSREQLMNIKRSLDDARKQVRDSLTGVVLQEALKRYDDTEKWADGKLEELDAAAALKQPVSDEKRLGFGSHLYMLGKTIWNSREKKQRKKIRAFIGSRETGEKFSIEELHAFADRCRMMGNQKSITIRPDCAYWKKFQILLSGALSVANMEAMESLSIIFKDDYLPETLQAEVEKKKKSLAEWWGIYDTDSAFNTIYWLLGRGHAGRYDAFFAAQTLDDATEVQRKELLLSLRDEYADDVNFPPDNAPLEEVVGFEVDKYMQEHSRIVEEYLDEHGLNNDDSARNLEMQELRQQTFENFMEHHEDHVIEVMDFVRRFGAKTALCINAWDIGRCANVVRWSYTCGYLTEAQSWNFLDRNARRAVAEYRSFGEFAHDYMLGRFFWQSGNIDLNTTFHMMEALKTLFDEQIGMWSRNPWVSSLIEKPE